MGTVPDGRPFNFLNCRAPSALRRIGASRWDRVDSMGSCRFELPSEPGRLATVLDRSHNPDECLGRVMLRNVGPGDNGAQCRADRRGSRSRLAGPYMPPRTGVSEPAAADVCDGAQRREDGALPWEDAAPCRRRDHFGSRGGGPFADLGDALRAHGRGQPCAREPHLSACGMSRYRWCLLWAR